MSKTRLSDVYRIFVGKVDGVEIHASIITQVQIHEVDQSVSVVCDGRIAVDRTLLSIRSSYINRVGRTGGDEGQIAAVVHIEHSYCRSKRSAVREGFKRPH